MEKTEIPPKPADEFSFPMIQEKKSCCPAVGINTEPVIVVASLNQSFVEGSVQTPCGRMPQVSSRLTRSDQWGTVKARFNINRMNYTVDPGLYALGAPDHASPVLVSANYKMSFDVLRRALSGINAWILVLDTKGINVWCAAGKGTFGTQELIERIQTSGLKSVVSHRQLILPQLGAPGVAAHLIKQATGFKVNYGPVRAADLPAYIDAGLKASPEMRRISFPLRERAVLIPVELTQAAKQFLIISAAFLILAAILGPQDYKMNLIHDGLFAVAAVTCAFLGGAVLSPLLLPWLPGRAFSIKGFAVGLAIALCLVYLRHGNLQTWPGIAQAMSWLMMIPAVTAYLAMNFTGCSTFTSLSGVKKEMRFALPLQISAASLGLVFWIASLRLQ